MRLTGMLMLAALGALAQVAHAEPQLSGAVLGQLEAVLEHCGRVNAANAEGYKSFAKGLTGTATEKELAEARKSAEYREAHAAASEQIGKLPKKEQDKACAEGLPAAAN